MNILKGTHIFTIIANIYSTFIWASRAGKICSCRVYVPIQDPSLDQAQIDLIESNACFGKFTNLYEYLIFGLWGLLAIILITGLVFFCTNACERCKEKVNE